MAADSPASGCKRAETDVGHQADTNSILYVHSIHWNFVILFRKVQFAGAVKDLRTQCLLFIKRWCTNYYFNNH